MALESPCPRCCGASVFGCWWFSTPSVSIERIKIKVKATPYRAPPDGHGVWPERIAACTDWVVSRGLRKRRMARHARLRGRRCLVVRFDAQGPRRRIPWRYRFSSSLGRAFAGNGLKCHHISCFSHPSLRVWIRLPNDLLGKPVVIQRLQCVGGRSLGTTPTVPFVQLRGEIS